ncbi:MAG TPA: FlgD immunoglobulin-like domain containing protein, partial [bacterium]|nr:FlgD immunoglobulin-like domain containing protein [bacterium]
LCFDDAGQLYAVKGGGNKLNDLLAIDKATGAATVIGSTGLKSVSGLAYRSVSSPPPTAVPNVAAVGDAGRLLGARPSPFRASTVIALDLPRAGDVTLSIHDVAGRRVRTLVRGLQPAGRMDAGWDGRDEGGRPVAAGVYLVRLDSAGGSDLAKVTVVR